MASKNTSNELMRFNFKQHPKEGSKETIEKFLLFPKKIGIELRWLERAEYEIENYKRHIYIGHGLSTRKWSTRDIRWINS